MRCYTANMRVRNSYTVMPGKGGAEGGGGTGGGDGAEGGLGEGGQEGH